MNIEELQKGALPDPEDPRDYKIESLGTAGLPPVDFSQGSGLDAGPASDQGISDACGPHAGTKYHWQLKRMLFSIRDLSARVLLPDYGSYARDIIMAIVKEGQDTEYNVKTPDQQTPQNMRDKTGLDLGRESKNREFGGFVLPAGDIDSTASAIKAYKGVLLGLQGTNEGWQNMKLPEPPKAGDHDIPKKVWGHFLYAHNFHMHEYMDRTKEKCIITSTSWKNSGVIEHHIRERYFKSGNVFNPWTLIPKEQQSMSIVSLFGTNKNAEGQFTEFGFAIAAETEEGLQNLADEHGYTLPKKEDGTTDFDALQTSASELVKK